MPKTRLSVSLPDTRALAKLIEYYIKIEVDCAVEEALDRAGCTKSTYYRRIKAPEEFSLAELRRLGRALQIPQQQLVEAIMLVLNY